MGSEKSHMLFAGIFVFVFLVISFFSGSQSQVNMIKH